jgi:predicted enzyme related to lactoylglutathione lyase
MKDPINWFEIPVIDLDRATRFWETVLGTTLKRETFAGQDLAMFPRGGERGVGGALFRDERARPSGNGTCVYLDARGDLDGCLARAQSAGGKIVRAKTDIGAPGFIALVQDTEGNVVGIHAERA